MSAHTLQLFDGASLIGSIHWRGDALKGQISSVQGVRARGIKRRLENPQTAYLPIGGKVNDPDRLDWLVVVTRTWARLGTLGVTRVEVSPPPAWPIVPESNDPPGTVY